MLLGTSLSAILILIVAFGYALSRNPEVYIHLWKEFLDSIASKGGEVLILFLLLKISILMVYLKIEGGRELFTGATGALMMSMRADRRANGVDKPKEKEPNGGN